MKGRFTALFLWSIAVVVPAAGHAQSPSPDALAPSPAEILSDETRIANAFGRLRPQRPGIVDAYVIVAALDTDPVFGREAREAGRVLASRFDAYGRTLVLAADEGTDRSDAAATPGHLALALGRVGALMDRNEDVLILYSTSHGTQSEGLNYKDAARGTGVITPPQLAAMLASLGIRNRLIILQSCYSGQFIPALETSRTVIATAASSLRPSFGCSASNDWTFFGHALINLAMRKPDSFTRQLRRAFVTIYAWERQLSIEPSNPQVKIGSDTAGWLAALDARAGKVPGTPVGRPPSELTQ